MRLLELNRNPSPRQLRQFGTIMMVGLPLAAWLLTKQTTLAGRLFHGQAWHWDDGNLTAITICAALGFACGLAALIDPRWLKPLFIGLSVITMPIGLVVGELVLMIVYFGLFTPLGLLLRLVRPDPLTRRIDRLAATYWTPRPQRTDPGRYFRQF
jgi:hypothetical protein